MVKQIIFSLAALAISANAMAAPNFARPFDVSILRAEQDAYRFETREIPNGNQTVRVFLAVPNKKAPESGFPAIYALDGNPLLETLTVERLRNLSKRNDAPVIVLVGYNVDLWSDAVRYRTYDYTPPCLGTAVCTDDLHPERRNGGAERFYALIDKEIRPFVESEAVIDEQNQTLLGHSYGGLFVLYTLFNHPESFSIYVSADPSMWFKNGLLFKDGDAFVKDCQLKSDIELKLIRSGKARPMAKTKRNEEILKTRRFSKEEYDLLMKHLGEKEKLHFETAQYPYHTHGMMLHDSFLMTLGLPPNFEN